MRVSTLYDLSVRTRLQYYGTVAWSFCYRQPSFFRVCRQLTSIPRDAYGRWCASKYCNSYFPTEKCLLSRKCYKCIHVLKNFSCFLFVFCIRCVRIQFTAETIFVKSLEDGDTSQIRAYFHSPSIIVTEGQPLSIQSIVEDFNGLADNFTRRGSGYILSRITRLTMRCVKYRPLGVGGSSWRQEVSLVGCHSLDCVRTLSNPTMNITHREMTCKRSYVCAVDCFCIE